MSEWRKPPIPAEYEGKTVLVLLDEEIMEKKGIEYHGDAVAATFWSHKLKTTLNPTRLELEWVSGWRPLE